jgi:O-antigen/teichoic acid export membrane protein
LEADGPSRRYTDAHMIESSTSPQSGLQAPRRNALRTFLDVLFGRGITSVLSLVAIILTAHLAPTSTTGIYTSSMGYALLLFMFLDLGSGLALVRGAASSDDRYDEIWLYIRTRALLTAVTTALGLVLGFALFPRDAWPAMMTAMLVVLFSFAGVTSSVGQVLGDVRVYRNLLILQAVVSTVLTAAALVVFNVRTPAPLVAASAAGSLVAAIAATWWLLRHVPRPRSWIKITGVLTHMRGLAILGLATGLSSIYARIDSILVLRINGANDAAFYGLAGRILEQARIVPATLLIPLGPFLASYYAAKTHVRSPEATDWLARLAVYLGVGLCLCLASVSDIAIAVVGGPRFSDSATYLVILSADLGLGVTSYVLVLSCIMAGLDRSYLIVAALSVIFNVTVNVLILPSTGPEGAAVTTVATEIFVMSSLLCYKTLREFRPILARRMGIAVAIMVAAVAVKLVANDADVVVDAGVSAILLGCGLWSGWHSMQLLRAMPSAAVEHSVEPALQPG